MAYYATLTIPDRFEKVRGKAFFERLMSIFEQQLVLSQCQPLIVEAAFYL